MQNVTLKDFKKGQIAYAISTDCTEIQPYTVKSVGHKYVTLDDSWDPRFSAVNNVFLFEESGCTHNRLLFPTETAAKEYLERKELECLINNIKTSECSLDQLRLIKATLETKYIDTDENKITVLDGIANTVLELISLLLNVPSNYSVSLSGMMNYSIAVDHVNKSVLLDDSKWIDEDIYSINEC